MPPAQRTPAPPRTHAAPYRTAGSFHLPSPAAADRSRPPARPRCAEPCRAVRGRAGPWRLPARGALPARTPAAQPGSAARGGRPSTVGGGGRGLERASCARRARRGGTGLGPGGGKGRAGAGRGEGERGAPRAPHRD